MKEGKIQITRFFCFENWALPRGQTNHNTAEEEFLQNNTAAKLFIEQAAEHKRWQLQISTWVLNCNGFMYILNKFSLNPRSRDSAESLTWADHTVHSLLSQELIMSRNAIWGKTRFTLVNCLQHIPISLQFSYMKDASPTVHRLWKRPLLVLLPPPPQEEWILFKIILMAPITKTNIYIYITHVYTDIEMLRVFHVPLRRGIQFWNNSTLQW